MARRTAIEAAATRQTIVDTARAAFATNGYAATSTTEISAKSGVTRGALYHHFSDKAALFETVFLDLENNLNETVTSAAAGATDLRGALDAGALALMEFMCRPDYRQIAVTDAPAVLGLERWHEIDRMIGLQTMQLALRALREEGLLGMEPTDGLALAIFGALTELGLSCARGDLSIDEAATTFSLLMDQLRA